MNLIERATQETLENNRTLQATLPWSDPISISICFRWVPTVIRSPNIEADHRLTTWRLLRHFKDIHWKTVVNVQI